MIICCICDLPLLELGDKCTKCKGHAVWVPSPESIKRQCDHMRAGWPAARAAKYTPDQVEVTTMRQYVTAGRRRGGIKEGR